MKLRSQLYRMYYILGQCYVIFLSFFLFKDSKELISNFTILFKRKGEILTILKKGYKFWVRSFTDLAIIRQVFSDEVYKPLFTNLKEDATFLDIGAYIGDTAIYASRFKKVKKILASEPLPTNLKLLRKNLKENKITNVKVINKAVSADRAGRMLYFFSDESTSSFIKSPKSTRKIFVPTITLADLQGLVKTKVLLLKCDVEGGEFALILQTPLKILSKINRLMIELHLANLKNEETLNKLLNHLEKAGFTFKIKRSFLNPKYPLLYGYRNENSRNRQ